MASRCLNLPNEMSSIATWIEWHKALKRCVGKSKANELFLTLWDKNSLSTTIELRGYMESQGVDMDKSALNRLTDTGVGMFNYVGNMFEVGSYASLAILIILIGGAGMIVFNLAKSPEGSARLVGAVATRGGSEMIGASSSPKAVGGGSSPKMIEVKAK